jgi:hypothetical protein
MVVDGGFPILTTFGYEKMFNTAASQIESGIITDYFLVTEMPDTEICFVHCFLLSALFGRRYNDRDLVGYPDLRTGVFGRRIGG